jgi:hypothetical protein
VRGVPASAEIYNCDSYGSKFAGWLNYGAYYEGVSAELTVRYGAVCDTDQNNNNFSTAWTMLASNAGGGGYVQSGFMRAYGSLIYHFAEQNRDGSSYTRVYGSPISVGEIHRYWQQWDSTCSCLHSNVDTTRFMNSSFDPFSVWTTPFSEQFVGEVKHVASDMPGVGGGPTKFANISVQDYYNHWALIPNPFLARTVDRSRWGANAINSTTTQIWTN